MAVGSLVFFQFFFDFFHLFLFGAASGFATGFATGFAVGAITTNTSCRVSTHCYYPIVVIPDTYLIISTKSRER